MRKYILFSLLVLSWLCGWCQSHTVSGIVVSETTGACLSGASVVAMPGGEVAVVTNDDGYFVLKSNDVVTAVVVSHVGYRSKRVTIAANDGLATAKPQKILLRPATIELDEVLVLSANARELVEKAISKIPVNYNRQAEMYHCFYRETAMKRQHYISVAEGVTDMYKSGYGNSGRSDRVAIIKGRRLLSPKQRDTLSVKVLGGPVTPIQLDLVKNTDIILDKEELNYYEMKMEPPTSIDDRMQYVVSISPGDYNNLPYALYYGRLYIDQQTLAFTRAELSLDMSDRAKATQMMLIRKPLGVRFRPKELSVLVDYRLGDDGLTRMSYLRTTFRFNCDWKRKLFATSFTAFCEMAVTSREEKDVKPIRGRESFDQRDAFFDKVDYFRDPAFWQDYNIIEPTESLDKAVHRLLKKY